jgi:hypothetical protein
MNGYSDYMHGHSVVKEDVRQILRQRRPQSVRALGSRFPAYPGDGSGTPGIGTGGIENLGLVVDADKSRFLLVEIDVDPQFVRLG